MKTYLVSTIMANYVKTCNRRRSIGLVSILFPYVLQQERAHFITYLKRDQDQVAPVRHDEEVRRGEARAL